VHFDFVFCSITRTSPYTILISPSESAIRGKEDGSLDFTFDVVVDTESFFDLLAEVQEELRASWMLCAQSFTNIDPILMLQDGNHY
jgi:hypothetical protein